MIDPQRQGQTSSSVETPLDSLDYGEIRRNVEVALQQRKRTTRATFFVLNLLFYIGSMAIMWGIILNSPELRRLIIDSSNSPATTLLMLPTVFWGMAVFFQFISLAIDSRRGEQQIRDQVMMREVSKAIMRQANDQVADLDGPIEKPKRRAVGQGVAAVGQQVRLSDDGELVPVGPVESSDQRTATDSAVAATRQQKSSGRLH